MGVGALWVAPFTIACRFPTGSREPGPAEDSAAAVLFGESRHAVGGDFYEKADTYFHRGVEHFEARALTNDPVQRLWADIAPRRHVHLEGQRVDEIMPWLRLATAADPHNVDAYLVAAFWLGSAARNPKAAEQVLLEARRNNPGDYRIFLEEGRLRLRTRDWARARQVFQAALACWPKPAPADDTQSLLDKGEILTYLGLLDEAAGQIQDAIGAFRIVLALYPERSRVAARLRALESGTQPDVEALTLLHRLFEQSDHRAFPDEAGRTSHDDHDAPGDADSPSTGGKPVQSHG